MTLSIIFFKNIFFLFLFIICFFSRVYILMHYNHLSSSIKLLDQESEDCAAVNSPLDDSHSHAVIIPVIYSWHMSLLTRLLLLFIELIQYENSVIAFGLSYVIIETKIVFGKKKSL